jgi:hypothetical protein
MFDPNTSIIIFSNNKLIGYVDSIVEAVKLCNFRTKLTWEMTEDMLFNIPKLGSIENINY